MNFEIYHQYLLNQSFIGKIYRRFVLYPVIVNCIGRNFVDVGCGIGDFLAHGTKQSIGVDINPYNVDHVNERQIVNESCLTLNAKLIPSTGILPIKNHAYPSVVCDQVIEHIDDPEALLIEMCRILDDNGLLLIGVPQEKGFSKDTTHVKHYNLQMMRNLPLTYDLPLKYIKHFYFPFPLSLFGKLLRIQSLYVIYNKV